MILTWDLSGKALIHEPVTRAGEKPLFPRHSTLPPCQIPNTSVSPPPISSLPPELLGEIFQHYVDEDESSLDRPNPWVSALTTVTAGTVNPIVLGHVCSHWRTISLSMPTLWSSLAIHRPNLSHVPVVRVWLERSGSCPLNLFISHGVDGDVTQHVATQDILALFVKYSHRWRSIGFVFQDRPPSSYGELLKLPPGVMSALESAHVDLPSWSNADADKLWDAIYSSPSLRRVDWGARYKFSASTLSTNLNGVPWTQLTHMTMQGVDDLSVDEFLDILQKCRELLELDVSVPWPETGRVRPTRVVLPKLRICRINAWKYNSAVILNRVSFPALTSLSLVHALGRKDVGQPASCSYITEFLRRSGCELSTVCLSDPSGAISEEDLEALVRSLHVQSVRSLALDVKLVTDLTVGLLTQGRGGGGGKDEMARGGYLPCLSALSLSPCKTSEGTLLNMVKSRLPVLHTIAVQPAGGEPFPADVGWLETLTVEQPCSYGSLRIVRK